MTEPRFPSVAADGKIRAKHLPTHAHQADQITETASLKVMTADERTKLAGVAASATANAADTQLRDRSTHTGTQNAATISDFAEVAQDAAAAMFRAGTNVSFTYDDAAGTFTINASGGGAGTTDPEIVRDTIGGALVGGANIQITHNDVSDTITIAVTGLTKASVGLGNVDNTADSAKPVSTAQQTAIDASKARATHTGTQSSATISDLTEAVQDIVGALIKAGTGTTVSYDDAAGTFTINASGGGSGTTDPEIVRDTIGGALVGGAGIQLTVNDAGDTITVASTAVLPTRSISTTGALTGGGDLSADRTITARAATDALTGVVELATAAETTTGTDTTRAVTPAGVKAALDARPAGLASGGILRAIWNGTAYVDRSDGTTITSATDRPTGTYFSFLGGPDPNALGLMVDGDEWKDAV